MRDAKMKILEVDDTLDEVEVFRDDVLIVVHDKDSTNVEFDVMLCIGPVRRK